MSGHRLLRRLLMLCVLAAAPAPHALGQPAPGREGDFARTYQEFRTNYLSELRKQGFVGSSFYFIRDNRVAAKELYGLADAGARRARR